MRTTPRETIEAAQRSELRPRERQAGRHPRAEFRVCMSCMRALRPGDAKVMLSTREVSCYGLAAQSATGGLVCASCFREMGASNPPYALAEPVLNR